MEEIKTLSDFYQLMNEARALRVQIVEKYLNGEGVFGEMVEGLSAFLGRLEAIPKNNEFYILSLDGEKTIDLDLSYEIGELKKDIYFLTHSEEEFFDFLDGIHDNFKEQVSEGAGLLKGVDLKTFITDRDGTVNNYCGRYASSVQSVYNAVFMTRFARSCVENGIILTSAPLDKIGLVEISVNPENVFVYAGSKGREYFNKQGERCQFPIEKQKQSKLDLINERLSALVQQPEYEKFSLIGSGLQFKFGQTTIARQDISRTIPEDESMAFLKLMQEIVSEIDPGGTYFRIEDTGKDVEIILTVESQDSASELKDFDKGDGVVFLDSDIGLGMEEGASLICGDTSADIPMISASLEKTQDTYAIFVTQDQELSKRVAAVCEKSVCVTEPDILVAILNRLALFA